MSILIKGMEMPNGCFYCNFRRKIDPDNIMCLVNREVFEETFAGSIETRRNGNCPLIELPPHGRLIDADDFFRNFPELIPYEFAAPTIIEAEEADDASL